MKRHLPLLTSLAVSLTAFVIGFGLIFGFSGCKATLEPGGAYAPAVISTNASGQIVTNATAAPDMTFYSVDVAFLTAYSTTKAIFDWERDNRVFLWQQVPKLKKALDDIRPTAAKAAQDYAVARQAYKAKPTPAGLSQLQTFLGKMEQLSAAASAVVKNNPLPSP